MAICNPRPFPTAEFDIMFSALSSYASKIESLTSVDKAAELAPIIDALQIIFPPGTVGARDWSGADALHDLLVRCIVRRKGQADFSEVVIDMLAAVQSYEVARGNDRLIGCSLD
jgi:hypothetical protein